MRRIPLTVKEFVTWLDVTNSFLQSDDPGNPGHKQYERLGLTAPEAATYDGNNTSVQALWLTYKSKDTRTLSIARALRDLRVLVTRQTRPVINRIATSPNATEQDATIFNFVLNKKLPVRRKTDIKDRLYAGIDHTGLAEYEVMCRYVKGTKLPKLLPGSDGVEVAYKITSVQPPDVGTIDPEGEGFKQKTYSAPRFLFKAGPGNRSKFLLIAFRWNYSPNTDFNGPWTDVFVMVIS